MFVVHLIIRAGAARHHLVFIVLSFETLNGAASLARDCSATATGTGSRGGGGVASACDTI